MPRPKLSTPQLRAWRSLLNAHAAAVLRITSDLTASGGLPLESYDALLELYRAEGKALRLRDLGERVVLTRSGISRLVSRLEKEGFVERLAVEADARGVQARLTPAGERAFKETWPLYERGISEHFAKHLKPSELKSLAESLERVQSGGDEPNQ